MTRRDVFVQILSEVTGKSKEAVEDLFTEFVKRFPQANMNEELSNEKSETLLKKLRQEKSGIFNWLVKGNFMQSKNQ